MNTTEAYKDFTDRLEQLIAKHPILISTTLGNVFTMRLLGNKTHGDLAEIAIDEFINQYMDDFQSKHVGKEHFRAKEREEDIEVTNELTEIKIPISLKAYGNGSLQLSTDKEFLMFPRLRREGEQVNDPSRIKAIFDDPAFASFASINTLSMIYNEKSMKFNILVFDAECARQAVAQIVLVPPGGRRKYSVYRFMDAGGDYICEVRYGDAAANALQRGHWTHTKSALKYFRSLTGGWIQYAHNMTLVKLLSHSLVSSESGHASSLEKIKDDIVSLKQRAGLAP